MRYLKNTESHGVRGSGGTPSYRGSGRHTATRASVAFASSIFNPFGLFIRSDCKGNVPRSQGKSKGASRP